VYSWPFPVTIGDRLQKKGGACGDLLRDYYLETIGNVALVVARRYLEEQFPSRYPLDGMPSMRLGPLKDWPTENQRKLFVILADVEGFIGVRLSESFHMIAGKSLSGICLPTEVPFYRYQLCPRNRCP